MQDKHSTPIINRLHIWQQVFLKWHACITDKSTYTSTHYHCHFLQYDAAAKLSTWLGPESYDHDLRYRCRLTTWRYCCIAVVSWILKVISYTSVQSVGPYNLTLSRPAVTSHRESSRRARGGKKRLMWLVSWPTLMMNRMRRSQRMDREILWRHHDIITEFCMISRYKKFPVLERYTWYSNSFSPPVCWHLRCYTTAKYRTVSQLIPTGRVGSHSYRYLTDNIQWPL